MRSRPWVKYVAVLVLGVMLIPAALAISATSGSQGPSAAEIAEAREKARRARCAGLPGLVTDQVQTYVSRFDPEAVGQKPASLPSIPKLRRQIGGLSDRVGAQGCDEQVFRDRLTRQLANVRTRGPLGRAVRDTLVANARDVLTPGMPKTVAVRAGADLAAAVSAAATGSTLSLAPGRYHLRDPLIVLQDLTLRGAGRGRTTVVSTAAEAAVLHASPVRFAVADLALTHSGPEPASVLVLRAGITRLTSVAVSGGSLQPAAARSVATLPDLARGGNGVVVSGGRLTLERSVIADNQAGGVAVSEQAQPRISGTVLSGNRLCGVCYIGQAGGALVGNTLRANGIAIVVGSRAAPEIAGNVLVRNERAGVVIQEGARPSVTGNRITGNGDIGIAVYGRAAPDLRNNRITGHRQVGVVVSTGSPSAPAIVENELWGNLQAQLVLTGRSAARVTGNSCAGGQGQFVLDGSVAPSLRNNTCTVRDQRG